MMATWRAWPCPWREPPAPSARCSRRCSCCAACCPPCAASGGTAGGVCVEPNVWLWLQKVVAMLAPCSQPPSPPLTRPLPCCHPLCVSLGTLSKDGRSVRQYQLLGDGGDAAGGDAAGAPSVKLLTDTAADTTSVGLALSLGRSLSLPDIREGCVSRCTTTGAAASVSTPPPPCVMGGKPAQRCATAASTATRLRLHCHLGAGTWGLRTGGRMQGSGAAVPFMCCPCGWRSSRWEA